MQALQGDCSASGGMLSARLWGGEFKEEWGI